MREDGLDRWVTFWAEKKRSRERALRRARSDATRARNDEFAAVLYDVAIVLAGMFGIAVLLHLLVGTFGG